MKLTDSEHMNAHRSGRPIGSRRRFGVRVVVVIVATVVCMALAFRTVDVGAVGKALSGGASLATQRSPSC